MFQGLQECVALGWDSQPFVPICTASPLSRFEAQTPWFCKPSHHTSEADLLFLSVKPLHFLLTALLSVTRHSDDNIGKNLVFPFLLSPNRTSPIPVSPPLSTPPPVIFLKHGPYHFPPSPALHYVQK